MCIVLGTKKYHIDAALSSDPIKDTRISTECGCTEQTTLFFVEMYFAPSGVFFASRYTIINCDSTHQIFIETSKQTQVELTNCFILITSLS